MGSPQDAASLRWQQVSQLFDAALDQDAAERDAFLAAATATPEVLAEVRQLLQAANTVQAQAAGLVLSLIHI